MIQPYRKNHVNCLGLLSELTGLLPSMESRLPRLMVSILTFQWTIFTLADFVSISNKMPEYGSNLVLLILIISECQEKRSQQAVDANKTERNLNYLCVVFFPPPPRLSKYIFDCVSERSFLSSSLILTRESMQVRPLSFFFPFSQRGVISLVKKFCLKAIPRSSETSTL